MEHFDLISTEFWSREGQGRSAESPESSKLDGLASGHKVVVFPSFSNKKILTWSHIPSASCSLDQSKLPVILSLPLKLNTFSQPVAVNISLKPQKIHEAWLAQVSIESHEFYFPIDKEELVTVQKSLCNLVNDSKNHEYLYTTVSSWVNQIAPDCKIENLEGEGWLCSLKGANSTAALSGLKHLQKEVLSKWKRQPYLILRRLTTTRQLAKLVENEDTKTESIDLFCNLLSISNSRELPLVMTTPKWKEGFCQASSPLVERISWGKIGLGQAIKELKFLQALLNKTIVTGQLNVHIPRHDHPTKDLWVQLKPSPEVVEHVLENAKILSMNHSDSVDESFESIYKDDQFSKFDICWHPLYGGFPEHANLASLMRLNSEISRPCFKPNKIDEQRLTSVYSDYLYESIIGESTFLLGNGSYKILQLPKGSYKYTLTNYPSDSTFWDSSQADDKSQGEITWGGRRARPRIVRW